MSVARILLFTLASSTVTSLAAADEATPTEAPAEGEQTAPAAPAAYVPHGFTMGLGLGLSSTTTLGYHERSATRGLGIAPLSLDLGAFLSPKLALTFRVAASSVFREGARNQTYQLVNGFYGPAIQYWFTDNYVLGGGAGLAVLSTNPLDGDVAKSDRVAELGFGLTARAEWVFARPGKHALAMTGDSILSFVGGSQVFAQTLNFKWQLR